MKRIYEFKSPPRDNLISVEAFKKAIDEADIVTIKRNFVEIKTKKLPFLKVVTAGAFINIDAFGGFFRYETSGVCAFTSISKWKFYKRVGEAFYLFGLVFNGSKNGKRKFVRLNY